MNGDWHKTLPETEQHCTAQISVTASIRVTTKRFCHPGRAYAVSLRD